MSTIKLLPIDKVLFSVLAMVCKNDNIQYYDVINALFLDDSKSKDIQNWVSNLYSFSLPWYTERGIAAGVRLVPVNGRCWKIISRFCKSNKVDTIKVMQALVTKSSCGEFTRHILRHNYGYETNKDIDLNDYTQEEIKEALKERKVATVN